jgi:hypothetical protein
MDNRGHSDRFHADYICMEQRHENLVALVLMAAEPTSRLASGGVLALVEKENEQMDHHALMFSYHSERNDMMSHIARLAQLDECHFHRS